MDIDRPKLPTGERERQFDCRDAIEPSFEAIIDAAVDAGWEADEIADAMLSLAADYLRERIALLKKARKYARR